MEPSNLIMGVRGAFNEDFCLRSVGHSPFVTILYAHVKGGHWQVELK